MDRVKWKSRLDKLDTELVAANDLVYQEKAKLKQVIQKLIDEANKTKKIIMNYADSLKEENINQRAELKAALQEKHTAAWWGSKAKELAQATLHRWHKERNHQLVAEDDTAQKEKIAMDMKGLIKEESSFEKSVV